MSEYLFSYGTIQKDEVQQALFGRLLFGSRDVFKGYKTLFIEIDDASFLSNGGEKNQQTVVKSEDEDDAVEGMVLDLSEIDLLIADQYEPAEYKRVIVRLESGKRAWIYMTGL